MDIVNPCRNNALDTVGLEKAETGIRAVRAAIERTRDDIVYGRMDPVRENLTEARLNALRAILLDPVRRLREELFVHETHHHADDPEIRASLEAITAEALDPFAPIEDRNRRQFLQQLLEMIPARTADPIPDDLPWPSPPDPGPPVRESWDQAVLRDR